MLEPEHKLLELLERMPQQTDHQRFVVLTHAGRGAADGERRAVQLPGDAGVLLAACLGVL